MSVAVARARIAGLYAVTPDTTDTTWLVDAVSSAVAGGARVVQYRNKIASPDLRRTHCEALVAACHAHGATLIVNDHVDVALDTGADGVHLGETDGTLAAARERLGPDRLLGASCYNRADLAEAAVAAGADHVAFGSFFLSAVKPGARRADPGLIAAVRPLGVPVVGIGGITAGNAGTLVEAGIDAVAVITAVFGASDVAAAARSIASLFERRT